MHYEEVVHPNEEKEEEDLNMTRNMSVFDQVLNSRLVPQPASFSTSKFVNWFLRIDESHLKPFLIRKYSRDRQIIEDQYQD
jgi:hypothetical protein